MATTLANVYDESASAVAGVLATTLGLPVTTVEQALTSVFHLTTSAMISALSTWFTSTVISGLGGAFSSVGSFVTTTVGSFFITTIGGLF